MHTAAFKSSLLGLALGAALLATPAHAQLSLTGNLTGKFTDVPGPNTTIVNGPGGSFASFKSGIPEHSWDLQTAVTFTQKNFVNVTGGLVADNIFTITNGRTLLHSTATAAHFDLWLNLIAPVTHSSLLTPVAFTITNTPNGPDPHSVDDSYTISASPIAPLKINNQWVQFTFSAPPSISIHEDHSATVGSLWVTFTPVPEPSTYAAMGAALLVGLVLVRRFRSRGSNLAAAA